MKDIILVGKQGCGKGTQAKRIAEEHGHSIFETGGALRHIATQDTPLGHKVKDITERGDLVPNDIVMEIVEDFVDRSGTGTPVIFDGIPRSQEQRASLEALLAKKDRDFVVLEITLSDEEAMKRLLSRAQIEGRADDKTDVILRRIENFRTHTVPLIETWRDQGRLVSINGEQNIEAVTRDIFATLGS